MCGLEYCQTCQPDLAIIAWTEGRAHQTPRFGDYAQRCVAERKRAAMWSRIKTEDPALAMEFPEFMHHHRKELRPFLDYMVIYFDRLRARVPVFAAYIAEHPASPSGGKGKSRRRRQRNRRRSWMRNLVHNFFFVDRFGMASILRQMLAAIDQPMPVWLVVPASVVAAMREQPMLQQAA